MVKKTSKQLSARTSIAKQVIGKIDKLQQRKIIDLDDVRKAHTIAENLEATVLADDELSRLDPLHALYAYALNRIDILAQQLIPLPECKSITSVLAEADEEYLPSYPPMSPITSSYFSCWAFFDLKVGTSKESIGEIVIKVSQKLSSHPNLLTLYRIMQDSRMGFYVHEGCEGKRIKLKELVTGRELTCIAPSGYLGRRGELWFARIFPDPFPEHPFGYSVVITTPYIVGRSVKNTVCLENWQAFFRRTLSETGEPDRIKAFEKLMKYGLNRHYWNEFIFEGYSNHTDQAVFLEGIPDLPETLPHSPINAPY